MPPKGANSIGNTSEPTIDFSGSMLVFLRVINGDSSGAVSSNFKSLGASMAESAMVGHPKSQRVLDF